MYRYKIVACFVQAKYYNCQQVCLLRRYISDLSDLTVFKPATIIVFLDLMTSLTFPCFPLSLPVMI